MSVVKRVDVLPGVLQFGGPFVGGPVCPHAAGFIFFRQQDDQANLARGQLFRDLGVEPMPSKPEGFDAYIRSETQKWAKVIRQANIKLD